MNKVISREYVEKNYIHKDKIREKIKKIDIEHNFTYTGEYATKVLQELLEEE